MKDVVVEVRSRSSDREGMEEIGSQIKVSRYPVEARIARGSAGDPRHVMQEQEAKDQEIRLICLTAMFIYR